MMNINQSDYIFKGQWSTSITYQYGNVVMYNGKYYVCELANQSSPDNIPKINSNYWILIEYTSSSIDNNKNKFIDYSYRGEWTLSYTYNNDDVVLFGDSTTYYICILSHISNNCKFTKE